MQNSKRKRGGSYYNGDSRERRGDFNGNEHGRHNGTSISRESTLRSPDLTEKHVSTPENGDKSTLSSTKSEDTVSNGTTNLDDAASPIQPEESSGSGSKLPAHKKVVKSYHSLNLHRLNWETYHSSWCRHGCINERSHFTKWREAYEDHLWDLYSIFTLRRVNLSKIDYNLFIVFVYNNSSRFISEFV